MWKKKRTLNVYLRYLFTRGSRYLYPDAASFASECVHLVQTVPLSCVYLPRLRKKPPRCLDVCVCSRQAGVLITGTDGSCLKPRVSRNDSRAPVIIRAGPRQPRRTPPAPTLLLPPTPLTSDGTCVTYWNRAQIPSRGMIGSSRVSKS